MLNNHKILAITLARGGSKGVPKKNIAELVDQPLIYYTIIQAKLSKYISRYIVSTDDEEIAKVAKKLDAEVPFLRPKGLASDNATSLDALQHSVKWCEDDENIKYDYVIELMCTNPMKTVEDIDGAIEKLVETGADSVIGVSKLDDNHPARAKKIINDRIVDFCVPELSSLRQKLKPEAYIRNGSIYAIKRNVLMEDGIRFGSSNSRPYIMNSQKSINIDNELDMIVAAELLRRKAEKFSK